MSTEASARRRYERGEGKARSCQSSCLVCLVLPYTQYYFFLSFCMKLYAFSMINLCSLVAKGNLRKGTMPHTCCVPGCRSGYRSSKEKASMFSLPSDLERREMWKRAIPRQETAAFSFESKYVRVCERHFDPTDVIRVDGFIVRGRAISLPRYKVKLRDGAIPRIFQEPPARLAKPKPPKPRARSRKVNPPAKRRRLAPGRPGDSVKSSSAEICDVDTAGDDDPNGLTQRRKRLKKTAAPSKCISTRTRNSIEPARRQVSRAASGMLSPMLSRCKMWQAEWVKSRVYLFTAVFA